MLNSEAQILRVMNVKGVDMPPHVDGAAECNVLSGTTLPLSALVWWAVPNGDLALAKSSLKSALRNLGYRVVRDYYTKMGGIDKTFAEFERDAGEGRKLKASVRIALESEVVMEVSLEVSPSSAC